ncbi:flagellar hook-length control protein FliK [Leisingera thetidis]|uniref:flagellar hook-length control protein FliK n=1 Tax=Leisingera thetidis TaxID=2930199 RepID=UPI0021F71BF0|nr:flagellar hook-length control protein FliK [Leisingera thetidis]
MNMNSILGFEARSVGKAPPAIAESSNKSPNSSDFSEFVSADSNRENSSPEKSPGAGESAAADLKAGSRSGAESWSASGEKPEMGPAEHDAEHVISGSETELAEDEPEPGSEIPAISTTDVAAEPAASVPAGVSVGEHQSLPVEEQPVAEDSEAAIVLPSKANGSAARPEAGGSNQDAGGAAAVASQQDLAAAGGSQTTVQAGKGSETGQALSADQVQGEAGTGLRAAVREIGDASLSAANGKSGDGAGPLQPEDSAKTAGPGKTRGETAQMQSAVASGRESMVTKGSQIPAGSTPANSSSVNMQAGAQQADWRPDGTPQAAMPAAQAAAQATPASLPAPKGPSQKPDPVAPVLRREALAGAETATSGRLRSAVPSSDGIQVAQVPAARHVFPQSPAVLQPLMAGGLASGSAEAELFSRSADLLSGPFGLSSEAPGLTQLLAEASIGTQAAHRPEVPRMIAAQLAEAFAAKGKQKVEVSLNPQELGHVKMRVVASETGITMVVQTERPETGDLMRRHIHELAEEFRRMGYEDISFEFSGGQTGGDRSGQEPDGGSGQAGGEAGAPGAGAADTREPAIQNLRHGSAGVDMRV